MMKKFFKREDKDLKYDFLPSALEIMERPPSPLGQIVIFIISAFIMIIIGWSCLAEIDQVIVTRGKVETSDGIKIVDSNINGKIKSINCKKGDNVKEGDILLEIENTNDIEIENLNETLEINKLKLDILENKIGGKSIRSLFDKYKIDDKKVEEIRLEEELEENEEKKIIKDYNEKIKNYNNELKEKEKELIDMQTEYDKLSDTDKYFRGDAILNNIKGNKSSIENIKKNLEEEKIKEEERKQRNNLQLIKQRNAIKKDIDSINKNIDDINRKTEEYKIKAPITGSILKINYNTIGSYVNQAKPIAEIIKDDSKFYISSKVLDKDISKIKEGQDVTIKVDAYDYQKYGTLSGKIEYISSDSIIDENLGLVYEIKISIDKDQETDIEIISGMSSTIEIKTEKIKVIDYFLSPLKKTMDNALKN